MSSDEGSVEDLQDRLTGENSSVTLQTLERLRDDTDAMVDKICREYGADPGDLRDPVYCEMLSVLEQRNEHTGAIQQSLSRLANEMENRDEKAENDVYIALGRLAGKREDEVREISARIMDERHS